MGSTTSHETYESSNKDADGYCYWASFKGPHFAEGASRLAYEGTLHGDGPRKDSRCVTKVFKAGYANRFDAWVPDLAASKKSKKFAIRFCEKYLPRLGINCREIEFVIPLIAKVQKRGAYYFMGFIKMWEKDTNEIMPQEYVAIEPFVEGDYTKFNSNGGWESNDIVAQVMTAFTHWTFHVSGHKFMVCDLQGVVSSSYGLVRYYLTDPVVHSQGTGRVYGNTDLGEAGMAFVMSGHRCNAYCRKLGLSNPVPYEASNRKRSTTYDFEVTEDQQLRNQNLFNRNFGLSRILEEVGEEEEE